MNSLRATFAYRCKINEFHANLPEAVAADCDLV